MDATTGNKLTAESLVELGVQDLFFLMGGPMNNMLRLALDAGIRGIDVRHEMAAAMAAHAYARITGRPGVCVACSGPGTTNLVTGITAAWADGAPVVAIGGSSGIGTLGRGAFQEVDQVAIMRPVTKWSTRVHDVDRIPEILSEAWMRAQSGAPGPVYVDLPGDLLYETADDPEPIHSTSPNSAPWPAAEAVDAAVDALCEAERPIVVAGSGVVWEEAWDDLRAFVEAAGLPVFLTPMARGIVPESHPSVHPGARSKAFREADCVVFVGTRLNYVVGFGREPRFNAGATHVRIDVEAGELARGRRADVSIHAACRPALRELTDRLANHDPAIWSTWVCELATKHLDNAARFDEMAKSTDRPIHPGVLCRAVAGQLREDDIFILDGQDTLNFGRQMIPVSSPRSHLNSGVLGVMGVGVPYGLGAKVAAPDRRVVVLTGDGSFGLSAMELDTVQRHGLELKVIVSNNGGWSADPEGWKPGRELLNTRYDALAEAMGCRAIRVDDPANLDDRLGAALAGPGSVVVEVMTDPKAQATTTRFSTYRT